MRFSGCRRSTHQRFNRTIDAFQKVTHLPYAFCALQAERQVCVVNDRAGTSIRAMPFDSFFRQMIVKGSRFLVTLYHRVSHRSVEADVEEIIKGWTTGIVTNNRTNAIRWNELTIANTGPYP